MPDIGLLNLAEALDDHCRAMGNEKGYCLVAGATLNIIEA